MIEVATPFHSNFQAEILEERPSHGVDHWIFPPRRRQGDGLSIRVHTAETEWTAICAFGEKQYSAAFTHPDPDKFCVISRGTCYIIKARNASSECITEFADAAKPDTFRQTLLIAAYGRLYCVSKNATLWRTSLDATELSNLKVHRQSIEGAAAFPWADDVTTFHVDPLTGGLIDGDPRWLSKSE